jgi:drug/metabolite transporter (DMT)-like permease
VAVALGLIVALSFGSSDFLGGRASTRVPAVSVLFVGQLVGVAGAFVVASLVGAHVEAADIGYGAAAGAVNVVGLGFLYQGLARARVGVVAPITAVMGALVPVGWALGRGERPGGIVLVGASFAIVAGGLIARERSELDADRPLAKGVGYALAGGTLLGGSLVLYSETATASGLWPVAVARLSGLLVVTLLIGAIARRGSVPFPRDAALRLAVGAGALDVTAAALLLVAIRHGLLVVVAPVACLAPAFTVVWAWIVLREAMSRTQWAGLALALVGLALVATG